MKIKPAAALALYRLGSPSMDDEPVYIFEEWVAIVLEEKSIWFSFAFLIIFALMTAPIF